MLSIGSLFSGAGLCDLGFHRAGFVHRFFCEADPFCRRALARHWPDMPIYNDVRTLRGKDAPAVDVLVGGFPCQDVSCSGKRAGIAKSTRSGLWYEYARIISEVRPQYAVVENVKGLLSGGMEIVLEDLSALGYDAEWACLSAAAFGAPHLRERVFVVAYPHRDDTNGERRILSEIARDVGALYQPGRMADWLGIRIDRSSRAAIRQAYGGGVLRRVDDGSSGGLDGSGRREPVRTISQEERRAWIPRLKALGNGIVPAQSYAVARCILHAEGNIE
jgi:DNA (cytosine-5)-methyltransferase 1